MEDQPGERKGVFRREIETEPERERDREGDVSSSVLKGVWGSALLAKHTLFHYTLSPVLPLFLYLHFKTLSLVANTP